MLTQERLKELYSYDPETGLFRANITGKIVTTGSGTRGGIFYQKISIDSKSYFSHRLAWLYVHGSFPKYFIDHIDGNGLNNRVDNLRAVTHSENLKNSAIRKNNSSGVTGVSWHSTYKTWRAAISSDGKAITLGNFDKFEDAVLARKNAEKEYGFHENHGRERIKIDPPKIIKARLKKPVIRINNEGFAKIISSGELGKTKILNLQNFIHNSNIKILIDIAKDFVDLGFSKCEVCSNFFRQMNDNHVICGDRCRTRKHRQKIRDELELDDE